MVKKRGRKPLEVSSFNEQYDRYMRRELSKKELAKVLNISRPTLDKLIRNKNNV